MAKRRPRRGTGSALRPCVGSGEVAGLSTCKGRSLKSGDKVIFKFPVKKVSVSPSPGKGFGRAASCSEIVRFSNEQDWEVI
jgi:DNA repair protein RAD5